MGKTGNNSRRKGRKKQWKNMNEKRRGDNQPQRRDSRQSGEQKDNFIATTVAEGNFKMEAYYAAQGLHHFQWKTTTAELVSTTASFEEWDAERKAWRHTLGEVLPASFRFCECPQVVSESLKQKMEQELLDHLKMAREWTPPPETDIKKEEDEGKNEKESEDKSARVKEEPAKEAEKAEVDTAVKSEGDFDAKPSAMSVDDNKSENAETASTSANSSVPPPTVYEPLPTHVTELTRIPFVDFGYQIPLDRTRVRKHPALREFQAWLIQKTECGQITRQETVSMIPPIVLLEHAPTKKNDSGLSVLDMCAAPGSKTSQLLEGLASHHAARNDSRLTSDSGVLVANDVNPNRANMLTHQLKRLLHYFPVAVVTAAPAQSLGVDNHVNDKGQFDLVLADVPCSGDGTTRKNINVWKSWSQLGALALHKLQLDIAWKGAASLCKANGGLICYSTCSLNPVENEAVVAELLRQAKGQLELVDARACLGDFKTRPGLHTWKVFCEPSTRREMRERDNKHGPKMQQRRREYEQAEAARKQQAGMETESTDDKTTEEAVKDLAAAEEMAVDTTKGDGKEIERDTARTVKTFVPTSMDEEYLMKMATEEAGLVHFESFEQVPPQLANRVRSTCFPPTKEEAENMHLERCMRCLGHDNNTGGFFVALLRKTGPISGGERRRSEYEKKRAAAEKEEGEEGVKEGTGVDHVEESPAHKKTKVEENGEKSVSIAEDDVPNDSEAMEEDLAADGGDDQEKPSADSSDSRRGPKPWQEFTAVEDGILDPLLDYYGLGGPDFRKDLFMTRGSGENKVISYIAPSVKDLLFDQGRLQHRVNVIGTGLKAFVRNSALKDCTVSHRIAQEAAHFLIPFMTKRKFTVVMSDFEVCLQQSKFIPLTEFSDEFGKFARPLELGAFVVILEGYEDRHDEKMVLVMWRCRGDNVNTLVSKVEMEGIRSKLAILKAEESAA